jgi:hypothetical protein
MLERSLARSASAREMHDGLAASCPCCSLAEAIEDFAWRRACAALTTCAS